MSERIDRYKKRRHEMANRAQRRHLREVAQPALVAQLLEAKGNESIGLMTEAPRKDAYDINLTPAVSAQEASALVAEMRKEFDQQRVEELTASVRQNVLATIVGPFWIGTILHRRDADGGPVTTVHNARRGVYAKSVDKERFETPFDRTNYERGFSKARRALLRGIVTSSMHTRGQFCVRMAECILIMSSRRKKSTAIHCYAFQQAPISVTRSQPIRTTSFRQIVPSTSRRMVGI
jgi:hypothetical protein